MKCTFCGRDLEQGIQECPYCHCKIEPEVTVLNPQERDTFEGVTIDEDGSSSDPHNIKNSQDERQKYHNQTYGNAGPQFKVQQIGCGSSLLLTILILLSILAVVFFLLPTFLIFAAVGAVVIFILRLFV